MGIDEISLKKGHSDFVVIISAYIKGELRVLGILKNRTKVEVKKFFLTIPKRLRRRIGAICSDLYSGFINAAKEVFGRKVLIIADRFHVVKLYRKGLESLRKKEMKRLKKELPESDYKLLKNVMWFLRKHFNELSSDEQRCLNRLFALSPIIKQAYDLCEHLTAIYNSDLTTGQAKRKISGWIQRVKNSRLNCFNSFLKTLKKNYTEIINYFINRQSSGFVEGLNNKIKVIKRRCYGITNLTNLFRRIFLDLNGYKIFT